MCDIGTVPLFVRDAPKASCWEGASAKYLEIQTRSRECGRVL